MKIKLFIIKFILGINCKDGFKNVKRKNNGSGN